MKTLILHDQRKFNFDWTLILIFGTSLAILIFSFYQQYVKEIEPCPLCKWQRYIYLLIFCLSPIGLIQTYNLSIRNMLNIAFLVGFCLAAYHTLIQLGWLNDQCAMTQKIENIADFMKMLEQPKVSCATIGWKLFGLSASIYNAMLSCFALIALNFKIIKRLLHV